MVTTSKPSYSAQAPLENPSSTFAHEHEGDAYFPFEYLADFFKFLHKNRHVIELITYADFPWGKDYDYDKKYPEEYQAWKRKLNRWWQPQNRKKIYIVLQHDVDSMPELTTQALRVEEQLGLRSSIMMFYRRLHRQLLQETGRVEYTDYPLDYNYLKQLEKKGFMIGYHNNAYEQSGFNYERANQIFAEDVRALQQHFNLTCFSHHGGVRDPEGNTNNSMGLPPDFRTLLRWVHNKRSPKLSGQYSDGGINTGKRDAEAFDLRKFVKTWTPGNRYRILIHPQYYNTPCEPAPKLVGSPWYDEVLEYYAGTNSTVEKVQQTSWLSSLKQTLSGSPDIDPGPLWNSIAEEHPEIYQRRWF